MAGVGLGIRADLDERPAGALDRFCEEADCILLSSKLAEGEREWIACADFTVADILLATVLREIRHSDLIDRSPTEGLLRAP